MRPMPIIPESRTEGDERLLIEWRNAPAGPIKDQKLELLLQRMGGVIGQVVNLYRAAPVPTRVLELEAKRQASQAFLDWQPGRGASLATYLNTWLRQRLFRWVSEHQNPARIPEEHVRRIGGYNRAVEELTDRFGREPSTAEVADHMGVPLKHVSKLRRLIRPSVSADSDIGRSGEVVESDPDYPRAVLAYYGMTEMERQVFDYSLGAHGKPQKSPGEIAKILKVSPSRVSALKEAVAKKLEPYIGGVA
ncbi:MAG TPA: sigma-70 domain-containing protein [Bryobacteraceae bacterium]|nr:sigma-70 domain-containing protein [Bryobacteraceae bacterium]